MLSLTRRIALGAAAGLAAGAAASVLAAPPPTRTSRVVVPADMNLGDARATVHLIEYMSLTCTHCAAFNAEVFPALKAKYIDTGRVYYTARELLTAPAQVAAAGVMMARCNGGARYFPIIDQILRSQSRWQGGDIKSIFLEIARANGLSEAQFEACLVDESSLGALERRVQYAVETDRVTSTPTFFINGAMLQNDRVPSLVDLDAAILRAMKPATRQPPGGR